MEKGVANYGHSRTGKLNLIYFGSQTAKIGPEFRPIPTGGFQSGWALPRT